MDITEYESYFHDGILIGIEQKKSEVIFSMWSSELDPEDIKDEIPISDDTIKGKLHAVGVKKIEIKDKEVKTLEVYNESGSIMNLNISKNEILIEVLYDRLNSPVWDYIKIKIEAEKIYWEPVPDLVNPY